MGFRDVPENEEDSWHEILGGELRRFLAVQTVVALNAVDIAKSRLLARLRKAASGSFEE